MILSSSIFHIFDEEDPWVRRAGIGRSSDVLPPTRAPGFRSIMLLMTTGEREGDRPVKEHRLNCDKEQWEGELEEREGDVYVSSCDSDLFL